MAMIGFAVPYGKERQEAELDSTELTGIFESGVGEYQPECDGVELVKRAFDCPYASPPLEQLAREAKTAVIIASDHTRPVPSKVIFPELLRRLRSANPSIDVTILIATGCHRGTTRTELIGKFGEDIVNAEKIVIHDCQDESMLISLGRLPSGCELRINKLADETDLLISEGFIEPHFFAGFSGGRKSVLPGIAALKTVMGNHCAKFISSPFARAGSLENNPLHRDMIFAAQKAGLKFIINVIINAEKQVIHAVAGDPIAAHQAGCDFLTGLCGVEVPESDIVITGNGGYPLDQNIYQSVKGMSAAETVCRPGGVIIMVASCADGHGGESFYDQLANCADPADLLRQIEQVPQDQTLADQWEAQILARILSRHQVIMVSDPAQRKTIADMHMSYASTLPEAVVMAKNLVPPGASIAVVPDGVAVVAKKIVKEKRTMKIAVCIKQVPGTTKVEVDPQTGVLKRNGVDSKLNPYDLYALETALQIKTMVTDATVTALTMGPPQSEEIIREAYMMGVDDGVILSDRRFAGSDVLATSWTLSQGILKSGPFDLIICGKQTTDGDTAQVGAELAEFINIPHLCNVLEIEQINEKEMLLKLDLPLHIQRVKVKLPCLISVEKGIFEPRLPSFRRKLATADRPVQWLKLDDLPDRNESRYGLNGSPTQVARIFPPESTQVRVTWDCSAHEIAEKTFELFEKQKFLQQAR